MGRATSKVNEAKSKTKQPSDMPTPICPPLRSIIDKALDHRSLSPEKKKKKNCIQTATGGDRPSRPIHEQNPKTVLIFIAVLFGPTRAVWQL